MAIRTVNSCCGNNGALVEHFIGTAYDVVKTVYDNLGILQYIYDFLNQHGVLVTVDSVDELKALNTDMKYARVYTYSTAAGYGYTDYLYVEGNDTGVIPNDPDATGTWIVVASSSTGGGESGGGNAYIPYVYAQGSALGGETTIAVPNGTVGVPFIIIEGYMNTVGYGFTFDTATLTVTLAQPLEVGDEVVLLLTGTPAVPDNPNISNWVTINWLYNGGYAVGGEQVIAIPYTFEAVPAIYKNGERYYAGLADKSYTVDAANQRILLTEPLATNDRLIVQIGGESTTLIMSDRTVQEVARSANVHDNEVILSTNTTQYLNGMKVIYDVVEQKIYGLPALPTNVYINSVSNGQLIYSPGNVTVTLLPNPVIQYVESSIDSLKDSFANKDGYKLLGEVTDVDELRNTDADTIGQLIRVKNYYSDKFGGGGFFRSVTPGTLVDDGGVYIKTTNGTVWRRLVNANQVTSADYGCWKGNVGSDNTARLIKATNSGYDVHILGENYNDTEVTASNFRLTGKMLCSKDDFSTQYGRTLLRIKGSNVTYDLELDMQNFGAGGLINTGTDTYGSIYVHDIYGAVRATYGLQNAVEDGGVRNVMYIRTRNILKGDSGVDPQPSSFTSYGSRGNYPVIDMYNSQGGIIGNSTTECVYGEIIARLVSDNGFYALENSRQTIGTMVADNVLGEPFVNAGGFTQIGELKLKECQGYGITYSYSGSLRIDKLVLEQTLISSAMPILRSRVGNVNSIISIGRIEGSTVLSGAGSASIKNSFISVDEGLTDLFIGDVDLTLSFVTGSSLSIANFSATSKLVFGTWDLNFVDTTGTLTTSSIAYMNLPTTAQVNGSRIGLQRYRTNSAQLRLTGIDNGSIDYAEGQPIQVNAGPYITSSVQTRVRIFHVTALPTIGKWFSGDKLFIITPGSTVKLGWVCTQTGDFAGTAPTFQVIA